jgi:Putative DNA-binding domain
MANPYTVEFLNQLIGQQETHWLEFKSSRDLLNENAQKRGKFISDRIVRAVSAFLNTDGGQLIIGIEEKDGVAVALSAGVPRSRITWEQLQSAICDRIQPAVAGYVSVFSVLVGKGSDEEKVFAFVVDVKPGITAYQADDKRYYVRRSGQNEAMEDKDVRLRMLAGDKPRLVIRLQPRIVPNIGDLSQTVQYVEWMLVYENVGLRSIPRAIVRSKLNFQGLSETGQNIILSRTPEYQQATFILQDVDTSGLMPGQCFEKRLIEVSSLVFVGCPEISAVTMSADIIAYIDDGLPTEINNYDLMVDLRPVIETKWSLPSA